MQGHIPENLMRGVVDWMDFNEIFIYALSAISASFLMLFFYFANAYKRSTEKNAPTMYRKMLFTAISTIYFIPVTIFFIVDQGSIQMPLVSLVFSLVLAVGLFIAISLSLFFLYLKYGYSALKQ